MMPAPPPPAYPVIEADLTIDPVARTVTASPCDDNAVVHCNGDLDLSSIPSRVDIRLRIMNPGLTFYIPSGAGTCLLFSDAPREDGPLNMHRVNPGDANEHQFRDFVNGCDGTSLISFRYFNETKGHHKSEFGFYFQGQSYYKVIDPSVTNDSNYK